MSRPDGTRPRGSGLTMALRSAATVVQALFEHRTGWALPLVLVLLVLSGILAALALVPAIAPFVYPVL